MGLRSHTLVRIGCCCVLAVSLLMMVAPVYAGQPVGSDHTASDVLPAASSCRQPATSAQRADCAQLEAHILNATVLLQFTYHPSPADGASVQLQQIFSHATIVDAWTLITHNHFSAFNRQDMRLVHMGVFTARGKQIRYITDQAVLERIAAQLRVDGRGGTQSRRLRFAQRSFTPWSTIAVSAGGTPPGGDWYGDWNEVAQINWDGSIGSTYVQWTRPQRIERGAGGERVLVFGRDVRVGASGGGVFVVGRSKIMHVGNNWSRQTDGSASYVALN